MQNAMSDNTRTERVAAVLRQHVGMRLPRGYIERLARVDSNGLDQALATLDSSCMIYEDNGIVCYMGRRIRRTHNTEWQIRRGA